MPKLDTIKYAYKGKLRLGLWIQSPMELRKYYEKNPINRGY